MSSRTYLTNLASVAVVVGGVALAASVLAEAPSPGAPPPEMAEATPSLEPLDDPFVAAESAPIAEPEISPGADADPTALADVDPLAPTSGTPHAEVGTGAETTVGAIRAADGDAEEALPSWDDEEIYSAETKADAAEEARSLATPTTRAGGSTPLPSSVTPAA